MGRGDNADLVVVRRFLDEAAQRVADLGEGQDHQVIQAARIRIDDSIRAANRAAGGFPMWVRTWLDALLLAVVAWATAALCGLVGLPSAWTIAVRVAAHRWGPAARTAVGFDWLRRRDDSLYFASVADRCVCQAINSVERWLQTAERDR